MITIIVLLIISGVIIGIIIKDNGLIQKSEYAKEKYSESQVREEMEIYLADLYAEAIKNGEEINAKQCLKLEDKDGVTKIEIENEDVATVEIIGADIVVPKDAIVTYKGYIFIVDNQLHIIDIGKINSRTEYNVSITKDENTESFSVSINGGDSETYLDNYTKKLKYGTEITINASPKTGYAVMQGIGTFKISSKTNIDIKAEQTETYNFDYTGTVQEWKAPQDGMYKLEVWGAQGGTSMIDGTLSTNYTSGRIASKQDYGGLGGYATGVTRLKKDETIYVVVGGKGENAKREGYAEAGYNGGGNGSDDTEYDDESAGAGGGATHIAKTEGVLSSLEQKIDDILIVAGGRRWWQLGYNRWIWRRNLWRV